MKTAQLHRLFLTCNAISTDTRHIQLNDMFFALKGDNFNGNTYAQQALTSGAKYAIIDEESAYVSSKTILVDNVLKTLQELAAFHRLFLNIPIIALTGSNGKTTTKELINAVLSRKYNTKATAGNLNNHIGVPLTLLSMNSNTEIGIVEMGANHLKEIELLCQIAKPDFGYITNFGKAHLEGFGGIEGVIKGKSEMYQYIISQNKNIFVNTNDAIQVDKTKKANTYTFGEHTNNDVVINFTKAEPFVSCKYNNLNIQSLLIGDYNYNNIAAAITIGNYFKVEDQTIKDAIENYTPTNNRSQIIKKGSNQLILDAYNANPTSMQAALLNLDKQKGKKVAILGDMFELGENAKTEHQSIINLINKTTIDTVYIIGENFYKTETDDKRIKQYVSFDNFKSEVSLSNIKDTTFLIKGSRGMALERTLDLF